MNDFLKGLLPTAASAILGPVGPVATMAIKYLADKLGVPEATQEAVTKAVESASMTSEGRIALAQIDADLKKHFDDNGIKIAELSVKNASDINVTMVAESSSEHWPTYSWRPAIGFAIAINVVLTTLTVGIAYLGIMFGGRDPAILAHIPGMIGSMAALLAAPSGIVGVASYFRGKAQADPRIATDARG